MKAFLLWILCLCIVAFPAKADEKDVVAVQIGEVDTLWHTRILFNGEIWLWGSTDAANGLGSWLAQVNDEGTVIDFFPNIPPQMYGRIAAFGNKRYGLSSYYDWEKEEAHYVFIPLLENGEMGKEVELPYPSQAMIPLPSGILALNAKTENPWLTFFDTNLNVVAHVEQPTAYVPELTERYSSLSISTAIEQADGILLLVNLSSDACCLVKIGFDGDIKNFSHIDLESSSVEMCVKDGLIYALYMDEGPFGANYLACLKENGEIVWKKKLTDANGVSLQTIFPLEKGFILTGVADDTYPFYMAVSPDGTVMKETTVSYMYGWHLPEVFLPENVLYLFGRQGERVVFEKVPIDPAWFAPSW